MLTDLANMQVRRDRFFAEAIPSACRYRMGPGFLAQTWAAER
ncbi:hypothetical protein [Streptomyces sp. AN091965]|nr:hypothetical protein [Streptomyces sp. AN091965]